jgi:hypothetical protein
LFDRGFIGGFASRCVTTREADWFVLGSLLLFGVSIAAKTARGKLVLANLFAFGLRIGSEIVA